MLATAVSFAFSACGDAPSSFLRQGRLPIYNFPMYASYGGSTGGIFQCATRDYTTCQRYPDASTTLNDPQGIASDNFKNIWVVERGTGRLLRFREGTAGYSVCVTGLQSPVAVALDSSNQIFVSQDTPMNIVQVDCDLHTISSTPFQTYTSAVTGFVFGVDDFLAVTLTDNTVHFGTGSGATVSTIVNQPSNVSVDSSGRFYIAESVSSGGNVYRFDQNGTAYGTVASGLSGAFGIAVDAGEDIYFVEQSSGVVQLIHNGGAATPFRGGIPSPAFLVMTRY